VSPSLAPTPGPARCCDDHRVCVSSLIA
jgi:hypothetical protein